MSEKQHLLSKKVRIVVRLIAAILLNLGIVFSAIYILFHLLEYYNPHRFIYSNMPWLPIAIPILLILSVLLYDLLFLDGAFRKKSFSRTRMLLIILCDLILFCSISAALYLKTCTNGLVESNRIEAYSLPTPAAVSAAPVSPDGILPADQTADPEDGHPAASPTAAATPVPLEQKFPEKFSDPPVVQSFDKTNVIRTLADGTEVALLYSYSGKNAAVDVYHYQKGKLEYQLADIYVRSINCFTMFLVMMMMRRTPRRILSSTSMSPRRTLSS